MYTSGLREKCVSMLLLTGHESDLSLSSSFNKPL